MSITLFAPDAPDVVRHAVPCQCVTDDDGPYSWCCDCHGLGEIQFEGKPVEVNFSNSNMAWVFSRLGWEFDYCGGFEYRELPLRLAQINHLMRAILYHDIPIEHAHELSDRLKYVREVFVDAIRNGYRDLVWG